MRKVVMTAAVTVVVAAIGAAVAVAATSTARNYGANYAADRAEIQNQMAYYLFAMDWKDPEAYASVFTEDGVLTWAGGDVKGRAAIRAFVQAQREPAPAAGGGGSRMPPLARHNVTNHYLVVNGNRATGRAYWIQLDAQGPDGRPRVNAYGHYEDELVKQNGRWLFTHRAIFNEQVARRKADPNKNPASGL